MRGRCRPAGDRGGDLEHAGDAVTPRFLRQLNKSFVTPFDREDTYRLASTLDDVVDAMDEATDGSGIIQPPTGRDGLLIVLAGLLGAIAWNLGTWWLGLPSSSSHALIGDLIGAALAGSEGVRWSKYHRTQRRARARPFRSG